MMWTSAIFLLLLLPGATLADDKRHPVLVTDWGSTEAGRQLAFLVREQVRGSSALRLVEAPASPPYVELRLQTIDVPATTGAAAYSVTISFVADPAAPVLIKSGLGLCRLESVDGCSRTVSAQLDSAVFGR